MSINPHQRTLVPIDQTIAVTVDGKDKTVDMHLHRSAVKCHSLFSAFKIFLKGEKTTGKIVPFAGLKKGLFRRITFFGTNKIVRRIGRGKTFSKTSLKERKLDLMNKFEKEAQSVKEMQLKVNGESIDGLFIQAKENVNAPTLIYFPGAADFYENQTEMIEQYVALGMNVIAFDYRGFGNSEGSVTSHDSLAEDAEAVFQYAKEQGIDESNIVTYGFSLGGTVSSDVKGNHPETTFISDRGPSDLAEVMELRGKIHETKWRKGLSRVAGHFIKQIGENFSPISHLTRLENKGKLGQVFFIECEKDNTLFDAKAGARFLPPENEAKKNDEDVIHVTTKVRHGENAKIVERIKSSEFLTKKSLVKSFRFFIQCMLYPKGGKHSEHDVYEALHSWYNSIAKTEGSREVFLSELEKYKTSITAKSDRLSKEESDLNKVKNQFLENIETLQNKIDSGAISSQLAKKFKKTILDNKARIEKLNLQIANTDAKQLYVEQFYKSVSDWDKQLGSEGMLPSYVNFPPGKMAS